MLNKACCVYTQNNIANSAVFRATCAQNSGQEQTVNGMTLTTSNYTDTDRNKMQYKFRLCVENKSVKLFKERLDSTKLK